jgi:uncharacterized repeat protein (TIGR03803 family)
MISNARFVVCVVFSLLFLVATDSLVAQTRTDKVLFTFQGGSDGAHPYSSLVIDAKGHLYGTTSNGGGIGTCNGLPGCGTVFELSPGAGGWTEKVLYTFTGGADGGLPEAGLVMDAAGNLYGTAAGGGDGFCGTVFELSPAPGGEWAESTLYTFKGGAENDGCNPEAPLTLDTKGNLYGTTVSGGIPTLSAGTVFEISPASAGVWTETVLYEFQSNRDGANPTGEVIFDQAGNLYGTANNSGEFGGGGVFRLTPSSAGWTETMIFSFTDGDNGCGPTGNIVFDASGHLYGTTSYCGIDYAGTVYRLTPTVGQWSMNILHQFTGGLDGWGPYGGLTMDGKGNLYGSTNLGGLFAEGTVFRLTPEHGRAVLAAYGFMGGSDGANPLSVPTLDKGILYGTTWAGGTPGLGVVYQIGIE